MKKGSTEGRRNGDTSLVSSHHVIMMESGSRRLTLVHHRCSIHWSSNLFCRGLDGCSLDITILGGLQLICFVSQFQVQ
jgi:hypothetical protein